MNYVLGVYHLYQIDSKVSVHKLAWSTQQASSMHLRNLTSLLSTLLLLWTCIITLGKSERTLWVGKNDEEELAFLNSSSVNRKC